MTQPNIAVRLDLVGDERVKTDLRVVGATGNEAFAEIQRGASRASREFGAFGRSSRSLGTTMAIPTFAIQNAAFQISDFAVQVGAGTSATRAFAQQAPQLLGGLGPLGAVLGGVVAILGAYFVSTRKSGEETRDFADDMDSLTAATRAYSESMEEAQRGLSSLTSEFGPNASVAERFLELQERARQLRLEQAQGRAVAGFTSRFGSPDDGLLTSVDLTTQEQIGVTRAQTKQLREVAEAFDLVKLGAETAQQVAAEFNRELLSLRDADTFGSMAESAENLLTLIDGTVAMTGNLTEEGQAFRDELVEVVLQALAAESAMLGVEVATEGASEAALALERNLAAAAGQINAIKGAIDGLDLNTLGLEAQNRVLAGGGSQIDARVEGLIAQRRAEMGEALGAQDRIVRLAAQQEIAEYEQSVRRNAAAQSANAALIESMRVPAATGGGGGRPSPVQQIEEVATGWALVAENLAAYSDSAMDYGAQIASAMTSAFSSAEDAVAKFVTTGKADVGDLVRSILSDISRIATRTLVTGPISDALSGLFGGGSAGVAHTGAMVGSAMAMRNVSPLAFLGAPRMHTGGLLGLAHDERPIIAQTGERILNRAETRAYNRGGGVLRVVIEEAPGLMARVRTEAEGVAVQVTQAGLTEYDRRVAPVTQRRISGDPRRRG